MARRELPEINAGSMADIAFLLLIFFLVTTTMDTDKGILKRLSPFLNEEQDPPEIRERNIFVVLVNRNNNLFVENTILDIKELKQKTKEFILNPLNKSNLPEKKTININLLGNVEVSKGVISLKTDRGTSYKTFITVMNTLMLSLNEVKDETSIKYFSKSYSDISKEEKKAIDKAIPVVISEAEPIKIGV